MTGIVNANREAIIRLMVCSPDGQVQEVEAVIDTGFTGFLTLPSIHIDALGLTWQGREWAMLGDGRLYLFEVYTATIIWDGQPFTVETNATDTEPLVGMGLLYGHDVRIQVIDGGLVIIEALS